MRGKQNRICIIIEEEAIMKSTPELLAAELRNTECVGCLCVPYCTVYVHKVHHSTYIERGQSCSGFLEETSDLLMTIVGDFSSKSLHIL